MTGQGELRFAVAIGLCVEAIENLREEIDREATVSVCAYDDMLSVVGTTKDGHRRGRWIPADVWCEGSCHVAADPLVVAVRRVGDVGHERMVGSVRNGHLVLSSLGGSERVTLKEGR